LSAITRAPEAASRRRHDLIVVGGGIYGAMLALEAVRRGLSPLLLERCDFGGATTYNSLRIVHGGLRYLQSLDLPRFRESVQERRWLLQHFPDLVRPLPCLMPLDGRGTRRPWILRGALLVNDLLSADRNRGVVSTRRLEAGRVIDAAETRRLFPGANPQQLAGGALWQDAFAPDMPRVVMETLRWACAHGATALNYLEVEDLLVTGSRVSGVRALDAESGQRHEFQAEVVINAAGPRCRAFAGRFGADRPELFVPSLAWNLLFDRPAPFDRALGVAPPRRGAQVHFVVPWKGRLLAGTGHAPWEGGPEAPRPSAACLDAFIGELNAALPGIELGRVEIHRVFAGLLPARSPGGAELTSREVIVDHGAEGELRGFFSVSGIKFTTARRVADKALGRAFSDSAACDLAELPRPWSDPERGRVQEHPFEWLPAEGETQWLDELRGVILEESVQHLDDLVLRRTTLGDNPARALQLAPRLAELFEWEGQRSLAEIERLRAELAPAGEPRWWTEAAPGEERELARLRGDGVETA
jgi:glycerol-3-phosphate dehydrogenase